MLQHRRRIDGRDFFWLVNNTDQWREAELEFPELHGAASIWDCETGNVRPAASVDADGGSLVTLVFKPYEAFWLSFDPREKPHRGRPDRLPKTEVVALVDGLWTVRYDATIQPEMEYPSVPPEEFANGTEKPLEDWRAWGLDKFSGLLEYSHSTAIANVDGRIMLDLGRVCHAAEVWVNGKSCGARLWGPHGFEVSGALRRGRNEIRVRVANGIGNSYGEYSESGLLGPVRLVRMLRPTN
jgi:hypothetical protein